MKLRFTRKRSEDKWILKNRKQKQETENNLVDHIIKLIESDDKRYSFEWSCGNAMEIYDKEKEVGYVLHIDKIEYDADGNATNL